MKEFGSDFHYIIGDDHNKNNLNDSTDVNYYACGRHAINALILANQWKRIWIPEYFCYHVIDSIRKTNIEIFFYPDSPISDDIDIICNIKFKEGDVLFRMNYFGLRCFRDNSRINVPIIEDHSHNLFSEWAKNSNADYCIASLRKTLPLTEGGVLWSPKKLTLPAKINSTSENDFLASRKLNAMLLKTMYLDGYNVSKDYFRSLYIESESCLDTSEISGISDGVMALLSQIDMEKWNERRSENWEYLFSRLNTKYNILKPEEKCQEKPFSLLLQFSNLDERNKMKQRLIDHQIYPAVLWDVPEYQNNDIVNLSNRLLSIHCDGRYDIENIDILFHFLNK